MLIYPTIDHYLNDQDYTAEIGQDILLSSTDRPFIRLQNQEKLRGEYPFLIERSTSVYEVGFPYIQISDLDENKKLVKKIQIQFVTGENFNLKLTDEILDESQITNDESSIKGLKNELGKRIERDTAEVITLFIRVLHLLGNENTSETEFSVLKIAEKIRDFGREEARLSLILSLNRKYELRHKLELITPKLRSQLNRNAAMLPLSKIQEMDAYCLRHYIRLPGTNAIEKAGARQELMGIQRYQNFNTLENRFLKFFTGLLLTDCDDDNNIETKALKRAINFFRQEPNIKIIPRSSTFTGKPNYVMLQNPIYRGFYQAYQDYLARRREKENIWGFRQALLVDIIVLLLSAALLNFEGSYAEPTENITIQSFPKQGKYLSEIHTKPITIYSFQKNAVFTFEISRSQNPQECDLKLRIQGQSLKNDKTIFITLFFWIFWFKPNETIHNSIHKRYKQLKNREEKSALRIVYLSDVVEQKEYTSKSLIKLLNPNEKGLDENLKDLTRAICDLFGGNSK